MVGLATVAQHLLHQLLTSLSIVVTNDDENLPELTFAMSADDPEDLGEALVGND